MLVRLGIRERFLRLPGRFLVLVKGVYGLVHILIIRRAICLENAVPSHRHGSRGIDSPLLRLYEPEPEPLEELRRAAHSEPRDEAAERPSGKPERL